MIGTWRDCHVLWSHLTSLPGAGKQTGVFPVWIMENVGLSSVGPLMGVEVAAENKVLSAVGAVTGLPLLAGFLV